MHTLAIYFSDPEAMGYPFDKAEYFELYRWLSEALAARGVAAFIVRGNSYRGRGRFSHGWRFVDGELTLWQQELTAELIFNRDDKNTIPYITDCPIINDPEFDAICLDKFKTVQYFPELSPRTALVRSFAELEETLANWRLRPTDRVVLKLNFATEGRGIFVLPVGEITEQLYTDWNGILLQEFLDSSIGIPGLTDTLHDLRVTVVNGEPINSFIRTPRAGSYISNISQGGTGKSLTLEHVPTRVLEMVELISGKVERYAPLLFAADFMNTPQGFKLVELNSRPGLQHPNWSQTYADFNQAVLDMLTDACNE